MKTSKGEICRCGGRVITYQTDTVKNFDPDESYRGVRIAKFRFQHRRCESCGATCTTAVFIGETLWDGEEAMMQH